MPTGGHTSIMTKTKKSPRTATGRTGRPPIADAMTERAMVRHTKGDRKVFEAEVERLTGVTGQRWTVSGYLRVAGLAHAGKHLA
jgi:hypothetical protein